MHVVFVSDRMPYIILRSHIIVLNVHAPTGDKTDDVKDSFYEELAYLFAEFSKYHMKILLGDLNAKEGNKDIFKPAIGNESLHKISNDNIVRLINIATSKNITAKIRCSHFTTSINILERLQMGKPTIRLTIF
jgi:exonuclease III